MTYPLYKELVSKQLTHIVYKITNPKRRYCPNCRGYLLNCYVKHIVKGNPRFYSIGFFCDKCEIVYIKTNVKSIT